MEGIRPHERLHFVVSEQSTCTVHLNAQKRLQLHFERQLVHFLCRGENITFNRNLSQTSTLSYQEIRETFRAMLNQGKNIWDVLVKLPIVADYDICNLFQMGVVTGHIYRTAYAASSQNGLPHVNACHVWDLRLRKPKCTNLKASVLHTKRNAFCQTDDDKIAAFSWSCTLSDCTDTASNPYP
jgi:hypothetical protein